MTNDSQRTLFQSYLGPILDTAYGAALYMTGDDRGAEDLLQAAVVAAFAAFPAARPGSGFKIWLLRILTEEFLGRQSQHDPGEAAVEVCRGDFAEAQIAAGFAALPARQRAVCALYFVGDFSYAEMAEMTGTALEITRRQLHEGRNRLLALLRPAPPSALATAGRPAFALGCA
jgi:RNA polymerase sigma factor (sigma-70 family)